MIHKEETDEHADISFKAAADAACRDRFNNRNNCGAPDATGGRECFQACRQRHRMGDIPSQLFYICELNPNTNSKITATPWGRVSMKARITAVQRARSPRCFAASSTHSM